MSRYPGLSVAVLLLVAIPGHAGEGRKEIFRQITLDATLGDDVNGKFFLSRDVSATVPGATIKFVGTGTENTELDLNGFTVTGDATIPAVVAANVKSFTIRNGTLVGGTNLDVLRVTGAAASDKDRAVIEDLKFSGGDTGIHLDNVTNFIIRGNLVIDSSSYGIKIESTSGTLDMIGLIEDNVVRGPFDATGIRIFDDNKTVTIRNNHVVSTAGLPEEPVGIKVDASTALIVEGNNVSGGGSGIVVFEGNQCRISRNAVAAGGFSGLELAGSDECLISENVFSGGQKHGIIFKSTNDQGGSKYNHIERNTCNDNDQQGIRFNSGSNDNTYGRNVLRHNTDHDSCATGSTCSADAVCDEGTGNKSFYDNVTDQVPPTPPALGPGC